MITQKTTTDIDLQRALVLLRAARDLLRKCDEGPFVEDALSTTAFYDEAECDGLCLTEDIESFLGIDEDEPVIAGNNPCSSLC